MFRYFRLFRNLSSFKFLHEEISEVGDCYSLLAHRVAVSHSDSIFQLRLFFTERLEIDCDTERRSDFVLAPVEFTDRTGVIVNSAHRWLQVAPDLPGDFDDPRLLLHERKNSDFDGGELRMQSEDYTSIAMAKLTRDLANFLEQFNPISAWKAAGFFDIEQRIWESNFGFLQSLVDRAQLIGIRRISL